MPPAVSEPTAAEREAELMALQAAFDEYIASSRELEEELDAELAKMQEKLAESSAANAALTAQLENIAPQLASLESALSKSRQNLKEQQRLRRAAEQAQDEADQRVRELEQTLQSVKEECDDVHEELAFKENELEETRLELEVEKQRLENDNAMLRQALADAQRNTARQAISLVDTKSYENEESPSAPSSSPNGQPRGLDQEDDDDDKEADETYVKKLEEELELVTEQLIETEKRLNEAELELQNNQNVIRELRSEGSLKEDEQDTIATLQAENANFIAENQKLRDDIMILSEELALVKEEINLQSEELQTAEQELEIAAKHLEEERVNHREAMQQLQIQLKEAEIASTNSLSEAAMVASTLKETNEENEALREQVAGLETALENAKRDFQNALDELEEVNARFDEAREEAKRAGREAAMEELKASMRTDAEHEINLVKESVSRLGEENKMLQQKVDELEMALADARDRSEATTSPEQSEMVKHLQSQLQRAKEDVTKKEKEMESLTENLEARIAKAEDTATNLEAELHSVRAQLAEAEAHLLVLRKEKERHENVIPKSPSSKDRPTVGHGEITRGRLPPALDNFDLESVPPTPMPRARSSSPSSVMKLELRLVEESKKFAALEKEYGELQDQKRMSDVRIKRLEEDIKILQKQLLSNASGEASVVTQMSRLSSLASTNAGVDLLTMDSEGPNVQEIIQSRDIKRIEDVLVKLEKKYNAQREYNAQLLGKMLHLQGNIQVYCRIRPMTLTEMQNGCRCVVEPLSETEVGCFDARTNKWKSFAFDRVWGPDYSQTSVFQDVEPLALSVVDGFNACIFAYGQTGSGKTYTMEGIPEGNQHGISYRTIQKIFHLLNLRAQQQRAAELIVGGEDGKEEVSFSFSLKVGMLEIYNDEIFDLLATSGSSMKEKKEGAMKAGGKASLEIRRDADGRVEVPNLTKEDVSSIEEVMELLKRGNSNRATAATDLNEHSSRSHMVLSVEVVSGISEASSNKGTLYLVDLAGSERVRKSHVEGEHLKEAGFINKSLAALGNVMEALDRKAKHIPYRDSKLTALLQNALGGNSRTMMVVATCPMDNSFDETVHALQFATRVRRIQIGAAQRNVTSKNLEETVRRLTEEMKALTHAKERTENQLLSLKRDNARVQDKLQNLSKSRAQGRNDSKTLETLRKNNDDMAARWHKEKTAREEAVEELEKARKELRLSQQQLSRYKSKLQQIEQKLEDKEKALEMTAERFRQERNQYAASAARTRRDEVLGSRTKPALSTAAAKPTNIPSPSKHVTPTKNAASENDYSTASETVDVSSIRSQVLALLQKYDEGKVDRIDIIMEKFKGKEALLLEKMTQRYESGSARSTSSFQTRNELALKRHHERMARIHEKRKLDQSNGFGR